MVPAGIACYLSGRDVRHLGAASTATRAALGEVVLPARLLGARTALLREATGDKFHAFIWHLAAIGLRDSLRAVTPVHRQVPFDPRRHRPGRCREKDVRARRVSIFDRDIVCSVRCHTGRTAVLHRSDAEALQIERDGVPTRFELGTHSAAPVSVVALSPDGKTCAALTGRALPRLNMISLGDHDKWQLAVYPLTGLAIDDISCLDVCDAGVVTMLGQPAGDRHVTLHRWRQRGGLHSARFQRDGRQEIVAVAPDGRALVLQSPTRGSSHTYLLNVEAGNADHPLRYAFRRLPMLQRGLYQTGAGGFAFSPDSATLAIVVAGCAATNALIFIDVASTLERTRSGQAMALDDDVTIRLCRDMPALHKYATVQLRFHADGRTLMQIPDRFPEGKQHVLETHFPWRAAETAIHCALERVPGATTSRATALSAGHALPAADDLHGNAPAAIAGIFASAAQSSAGHVNG